MKRLIKLLISITYYIFIQRICNSMVRRFKKSKSKKLIILCYHSIHPNEIKLFAKQLDYIIKVTTPIRLDHDETLKESVRYSIVTFDDAYQGIILNGAPELLKRKIPFTIFISSGQLGKKPNWQEDKNYKYKNGIIASIDDLLALPKEFITFGSHTINHPLLTTLSDEQAYQEIKGSKDQLESLLNKEIKYLAFPYGDYNQQVLELCKRAGYRKVFTIDYLSPDSQFNRFEVGRVCADPSDWMLEFRLKVLGAYSWMHYASAIKQKLKKSLKLLMI